METTNEPAPRQDSAVKRLAQRPSPNLQHATNSPSGWRVLNDKQDEEEKEAGYGHGV